MRTRFVLILHVFLMVLKNNKGGHVFFHHGNWTPIPDEEMNRRLNMRIPETNKHIYSLIEITTENSIDTNDVIKIVQPQAIVMRDFVFKRFAPELQNNTKGETNTSTDSYTIQDITSNARKAKKVAGWDFGVRSQNSLTNHTDLFEDVNKNRSNHTYSEENVTSTYGVHENEELSDNENFNPETLLNSHEYHNNIDSTDLSNSNSIKTPISIGYEYQPPDKSSESNNFNDMFHSILSKYNIHTDDKLTNYAESLVPNSRNHYAASNVVIPYLPRPLRYNNPNHLPVDPLMAVFLSNYGYYLPNFYGIQNKYKNLYGYLASNNIHNNRPFGLYKIHSDTDSSNK